MHNNQLPRKNWRIERRASSAGADAENYIRRVRTAREIRYDSSSWRDTKWCAEFIGLLTWSFSIIFLFYRGKGFSWDIRILCDRRARSIARASHSWRKWKIVPTASSTDVTEGVGSEFATMPPIRVTSATWWITRNEIRTTGTLAKWGVSARFYCLGLPSMSRNAERRFIVSEKRPPPPPPARACPFPFDD